MTRLNMNVLQADPALYKLPKITAQVKGTAAKPDEASRPETNSALLKLFRAKSFEQKYQPDSTILLHGYPANAIYLIVSGTVRCCTISTDGTRQIFRFAGKGEFIGIADIDTWHYTAEAVNHVTLKSVSRDTLEQSLAVNIPLRQEIRQLLCALIQAREKQLMSMVTTKASERLFQFLTDFAKTRPATGYVALPMCRRDIADHLGLSVETVSRAFGDLKGKGYISLASPEKYKITQNNH